MKKNLLMFIAILAFAAGSNSLMAQWAEYNCDELPDLDVSVNVKEGGATLLGGTSEIIVDPDSTANNLWKFNVDTEAADEIKYSWYPSYWDFAAAENTYVPAPTTAACKFMWIDTTFSFGKWRVLIISFFSSQPFLLISALLYRFYVIRRIFVDW